MPCFTMLARLTLAFSAAFSLHLAHAATWPERPIRIIVGAPAGAASDMVARVVGSAMADLAGATVIVDDRPGAAGNIGSIQAARAPADGYTLLISTVNLGVNPIMYRDIGYNPYKDFVPIAMAASMANAFFVNSESKASSLPAFLAMAQTEKLAYSSPGNGTASHLAAEMLLHNLAKSDILHVPYAPAASVNAVVGGQVPMGVSTVASVAGLAKGGRLRLLAVTSAHRNAQFPDVPTVQESGFPGYEANTWFAIFAPAGLAPEVQERLHVLVTAAVATPKVKEVFDRQGIDVPEPMDSARLRQYIYSEFDRWGRVVGNLGIHAD